jgi:hypothetical protein
MGHHKDSHEGTHCGCPFDGGLNVTGRRHRYQPDGELKGNPNEMGAYQDDWQSNEDITAPDGMATDGDGRLDKA